MDNQELHNEILKNAPPVGVPTLTVLGVPDTTNFCVMGRTAITTRQYQGFTTFSSHALKYLHQPWVDVSTIS